MHVFQVVKHKHHSAWNVFDSLHKKTCCCTTIWASSALGGCNMASCLHARFTVGWQTCQAVLIHRVPVRCCEWFFMEVPWVTNIFDLLCASGRMVEFKASVIKRRAWQHFTVRLVKALKMIHFETKWIMSLVSGNLLTGVSLKIWIQTLTADVINKCLHRLGSNRELHPMNWMWTCYRDVYTQLARPSSGSSHAVYLPPYIPPGLPSPLLGRRS